MTQGAVLQGEDRNRSRLDTEIDRQTLDRRPLRVEDMEHAGGDHCHIVAGHGVWGAVEQKTGLRIIVGWVSERPKLATGD